MVSRVFTVIVCSNNSLRVDAPGPALIKPGASHLPIYFQAVERGPPAPSKSATRLSAAAAARNQCPGQVDDEKHVARGRREISLSPSMALSLSGDYDVEIAP